MVARLAREEREKEAAAAASSSSSSGTGSWFGLGLWGDAGKTGTTPGRWAAEENVVKDRTRRAQEVLDELEVPSTPFSAIFSA